jgi:ssDNA-specific exonuclease RecJ
MSTVTFRHENQKSFKLKGVKHLVKESIIDGEKGLSFVLTKKAGEKFHRIYVKETAKDNFELKEKIDDKESTKEIDMAELKKMLKAEKDLEFVKDYVENERSSYK